MRYPRSPPSVWRRVDALARAFAVESLEITNRCGYSRSPSIHAQVYNWAVFCILQRVAGHLIPGLYELAIPANISLKDVLVFVLVGWGIKVLKAPIAWILKI